MNSKGFTLVEVIAIIVILAGIFLVSFPAINNIAKNDEDKLYDNMVNDLCAAGKSYMYAHMQLFPELSTANSKIEIPVIDLINYGNVDGNLTNPKTKKSIKKDILKYTILNDFSLNCKYMEE